MFFSLLLIAPIVLGASLAEVYGNYHVENSEVIVKSVSCSTTCPAPEAKSSLLKISNKDGPSLSGFMFRLAKLTHQDEKYNAQSVIRTVGMGCFPGSKACPPLHGVRQTIEFSIKDSKLQGQLTQESGNVNGETLKVECTCVYSLAASRM